MLSQATFGQIPLRKSSDHRVRDEDMLDVGNNDLKKLEFLSISSDRRGKFKVK